MPTVTGRATDFITFSRPGATGGGATVTDRDGKIKWAGHNLLTNSESFDASAWVKDQGGSTLPAVTANNAAAPNGTTTADKVDFGAIDAAGDYSFVYQSLTLAADGNYTAGIWVKAFAAGDVGKKIWLRMWNTATVGQIAVTLTADWQYASTSGALTAGGARRFDIVTLGSTFGGENQAAVSVLLWGAHLYRSDLGGMVLNPARGDAYYPTTPRNLLGFTEDFTGSNWFRDATVTSNTEVAPNGLQTADTISGAVGTYVAQILSGANLATPYTVSVYLKAGTANIIRVAVYKTSNGQNGYVDFNLTSGTAGTPAGNFPPTSVAITPVGGWYRCSFKTTYDTGTGIGVALYNQSGASGNYYAWGAQLSDSASLDAYSPVYGAAVTSAAYYAPRLDYDANGSALGLLVEEQRTNLITYSADFTQWSAQSGVSVTANQAIAPDGTLSADLIVGNGTTGVTNGPAAVSGASNNTKSVWLRSVTGTATVLLKDPQFTIGTVTCNLTTTWQRFILTETQSGGQAGIWIDDVPAAGIYAWGAQLEQGSFATSYIPTGASTATRTADVASVSTQAFPYSASEGTLVASGSFIAFNGVTSSGLVSLAAGSSSNHMSIYRQGTTPTGIAVVTTGSSDQAFYTPSLASQPIKGALTYKASDFNFAFNGTASTTTTSGTVPTVNTLYIGGLYDGTFFKTNGWIRQITYLPRRISNSELAARTV